MKLGSRAGALILAQTAPVPPVSPLNRKLRIAGLGDGAAEDIEGADVVLPAGALAKPVI
jgi:hypothetical protein